MRFRPFNHFSFFFSFSFFLFFGGDGDVLSEAVFGIVYDSYCRL